MTTDIFEVMPRAEIEASLAQIATIDNSYPRLAPETDDTGRFQRAVSALDGKGNLLLSPQKTYTLSGNIDINTGLFINGNGATVTGGSFTFHNSCLFGGISYLTLNGTIVNLYGVSNIQILFNWFQNQNDNAINCFGSTSQALNDINISYNRFESINPSTGNYNTSGRGLYMSTAGNCYNLKITFNKMDTIHGGSAIYVSGIMKDFDISHNVIKNTDGMGIELYQVDSSSTGKVHSNQLFNLGILRTSNNSGVGCTAIYGTAVNGSTMEGIIIEDNKIDHTYENGIEGQFGLVKGNRISYTGYDLTNHNTPSPEGIYDGLKVVDNIIRNPGGHGIRYQGSDTSGVTNRKILRNTIINDSLNASYNGIDLKTNTSSDPLQNIAIEDNHVEGFGSVINLFSSNQNGNNIKGNTLWNCNNYLSGSVAQGLNLKGDGQKVLYFQNDTFTNWTNTTTLANWNAANATLSQVADGAGRFIPKVLATDTNHGRITQQIQIPDLGNTKLLYLEVRLQSTAKPLINVFPVNADGSLNYASGATYNFNTTGTTNFYSISTVLSSGNHLQIEIGTSGVANDYLVIKEVKTYLIDKEAISA